jgi:carboxypeptidase Q
MPISIRAAAAFLILAAASPVPTPAQGTENIDLAALAKIRDEGLKRSKVMDVASYLTDVYGARLTGSPNIKAAGDWTLKQLKDWGMTNPRYEVWGPFGRGWSNEKITARVVAPNPYPLIAYSGAWSPGTKGPVTGDVVVVEIDSVSHFERYRGKLAGKWVMLAETPAIRAHFTAMARRFSDTQLDSMAVLELEQEGGRGGGRRGGRGPSAEFVRERTAFLVAEKVAGELRPGTGRSDGGSLSVGSTGQRQPNAVQGIPTIVIASEQYGRIARTLAKGVPVKVEIDAQNRFYDVDLNSFNIVADIPGTDPRLRDELVMLGAHFDSWHSGSGATDNAAGSAVMLEALRILKSTGLPMRRTVRLALWTGEEQGLLGSRAFVTEHFGTMDTVAGLKTKPGHAKLSAYFNMDNGTGAMRGVYAQGNAAVRPIFQQWMEPLKDLGMRVTTIRSTGSTDHASFDRVGLPGFQFIQDPIEYSTFTHHSNQDQYDRLQAEDLMKNAVIVASFVYLTANRDEKLPRKPVAATLTP